MRRAGVYTRRTSIVVAVAAIAGVGLRLSRSDAAGSSAPRLTYYLDPAGSDDADGLSPGTAWRTLDRVRDVVLAPGHSVLLRGGARFTGMLQLDHTDAGSAAKPVTIGSFGVGKAIIATEATSAVYIHNTAGVEIRDLEVIGDSAAYTGSGGIVCYNDLSDGRVLDHIVIAGVEASGFKNGIEVGAANTGFRDVTISDSLAHDNMEAGVAVYGPSLQPSAPRYAHANVTVSSVQAYRNAGDAKNTERNTGNGIVLGSVSTGLIEQSAAYENGWLCAAPQGPAGIWTYDSTAVVIEHNVAHDNYTGGDADGDGFDLDQNTSDCVLQNNVAYNNDGAGLMLYAETAGTYNRNNIIRNNVSTGSPRNAVWYGGITVAGNVTGADISGNSVTVSGAGSGPGPGPSSGPGPGPGPSTGPGPGPGSGPGPVQSPVVRLAGTLQGVVLSNNRLTSDGAGPIVATQDGANASAVLKSGNQLSGP